MELHRRWEDLSEVRTAIDHAIKYGGALGILWHDGDGTDEAPFKSSMDYLYRLREANVIDLVNYETFFNRFTNPMKGSLMSMDKTDLHGLLHTGKPDLEALYRVGYIPMVTRAGVGNGLAGMIRKGSDGSSGTMPWRRPCSPARNHSARSRGLALRDAGRPASHGRKVCQMYQEIKARKPGWRIGWYDDPVRRNYWA